MTCYFRQFDRRQRACQYRPDGQPDPCHLIPKQRLAKGGVDRVWDVEWVVAGCRRHHHLFDGKQIRLKEDDYPQRFRAHARANGFYFAGERDGWRKRAG